MTDSDKEKDSNSTMIIIIVIVILIVIAISGYLAYYYFYNSAVNTVESYDVDYLDDVPEYGQNELEYFEYDYDY